MLPDNKEPKRGSIQWIYCLSLKEKKIDTSTSITDQSSQTSEANETTCYPSDKTSKLLISSS